MLKQSVIAVFILVVSLVTAHYFWRTSDKDSDVLYVGVNANFPPFEYIEGGALVGLEIDLVRALASVLKKEVVFKDMTFDALLLEAQLGRIHIIAGALTPTQERSKYVLFTKPYLEKDPLIVITRTQSIRPNALQDLRGTTVVVNDGYTAESFMATQEGISLKRIESPAEAFFALQHDQDVYAFVSARSAVQPFFDKYGTDAFDVLELPVYDNYALAVSKKYPELFQQVEFALQLLRENGTIDTLKEKWHLDF